MSAAAKQLQASALVGALEVTWEAIRKAHPDVPPAIIVIASGHMGRGRQKLGHFAPDRWRDGKAAAKKKGNAAQQRAGAVHEVLVSGEGLARGAADVLDTLLHEAAHGIARVRGVADTSRSGRYHNRRFRALAEEMGLHVEGHPSHGWALTSLTPETAKRWAKAIKALDKAIAKSFRVGEPEGQQKAPGSRMLKAACGCALGDKCEPRIIRVARAVFDVAPITCGECGCAFELEGEG